MKQSSVLRHRLGALAGVVFACLVVLSIPFGCSTSTDHPPPNPDTSDAAADHYTPPPDHYVPPMDSPVADTAMDSPTDTTMDVTTDANTCMDGMKDGQETDVDCGGPVCMPCDYGKACLMNRDCRVLTDGGTGDCKMVDGGVAVCVGPGCTDGVQDGQETDVDCGGPQCNACPDGKHCKVGGDCVDKVCSGTVCQAATCSDGVQNGQETDIDCGGGTCPKCLVGKKCGGALDCTTALCEVNGNPCPGANMGCACVCPGGMVIMPTAIPSGGSYCIDAAEVTLSEYVQFWNANPVPQNQPTYCSWNTSYTPSDDWPPVLTPGPTFNGGYPVHFVDWCDARAYCAWANKTLCGKIGGGSVAQSDYNNRLTDAWYNACSAVGANAYPYGSSYVKGKCNDVKSNCLEACPGNFCGTISDGCGGTLTCGSCTPPQTCGGSGVPNRCGCTAQTMCPAPFNCGVAPDGCGGLVNCGTCTGPATCGGGGTPNVCGVGTCTPLTCPANTCGTISDGCGGTLTCGSCTAPQTCGGGGAPNRCGCTPLTACPSPDLCGSIPDGCGGTITCGSCPVQYEPGCGAGGTPTTCSLTYADRDGQGNLLNVPCQGGAPGLYQMSGNVSEWQDSCDQYTGMSDNCNVRGGAYDDTPTTLACGAAAPPTHPRNAQDVRIGFRCCL